MTDEKQPTAAPGKERQRTGPVQFVKESRQELRRVQWPTRRELASYFVVVLIAVTILTAYVFGLDQLFGQIIFWIFG